MMQMIILGIVQGLTEFLPVSSSAHLVFTEHFLGIPRPGVLLEAVLHLGTALAAAVLFWPDLQRIWRAFLGRGPAGAAGSAAASPQGQPRHTGGAGPGAGRQRERDPYLRVGWLLLLATAITGVIGLAFAGPLERMFHSVRGTAIQLLLTGVILALARERGGLAMSQMTIRTAAAVGLAQGISIVPGISRSGITIAVAMWTGLTREEAARFSFLAAIPAISAAGLFSLRDFPAAAGLGYTPGQLVVGFAVSAVFGAAAIRWLLQVVRRGRLAAFAAYCWAVGLAVLLSTFR
ncbi:MAG: undecaprenyl-diphosphate phosphatase [Armatimonadota bacterium]|nr:undecaprenyl-diphosphate phosphatase [Armatimonadota bacterium]MDR7426844.1 undecaprenyl-diphosphate phosphatase [Armatimonadota bacterium]MDR7464484.1 undecaprenyl-diphosphate phosphatase [Armatimonadota bacterium]MDR7468791.1 undecaprenyl-diphosphate phosphatase [Armatimonadota bacterium]MDR7473688.1 undecaprenyl-diphosphate phosphatase [Armatimonadota bacterium]